VEDDAPAVGGELGVELDPRRAQLGGAADADKRVLGRVRRGAPMADDQRQIDDCVVPDAGRGRARRRRAGRVR
jgi:hypothetical protein